MMMMMMPHRLWLPAALVAGYPFFDERAMSAGMHRGQKQNHQGLDVGSRHLAPSADVEGAMNPENVVRDIGFRPES